MAPALPNRDSVTTIQDDGSRRYLYPAETRGRFTWARRGSALVLIAVYLSLPWIPVGGHPAVFLDVAARRFHLFGLTFVAQDLWLTFFLLTGMGFSLFFVTSLFGRVWCGWACPHTVFLDHVYRRIEHWIEGDAVRRRALAAAPWSGSKVARRLVKHGLYLAASAVIAHLFLAYFVSLPAVWSMVRAAPAAHAGTFLFMAISTGALYFNFAWFREQLCIVICPYGRMQSALIDDHSLVIGYDANRGEPRGKASTPGAGACVDCSRCVQVCPTGIDIRQGLQMECIGCTACIDACDDVMTRLHRPRGLIRYDSQAGFAGRATRWWRPRTVLYGVLLTAGIGVAAWALSTLRSATFEVTRIPGAPYVVETASIRNQFFVRIVNKGHAPARYALTIEGAADAVRMIGGEDALDVGPLSELVRPIVLQQPRSSYAGPFVFKLKIADGTHRPVLSRTQEFLGPEPRLLREEETHDRGP